MKNKILTLGVLLVALVALTATRVAAQESAKPAEPGATEPKKEAAPEKSGEGHEAKAEGEKHEEEGGAEEALKESAMVKKIGGWLGLSPKGAYWVFVLLNFAVMAGLIGMLMKSKLPGVFRERTAAIQKGMEEARKASAAAQERLTGIEARLAKMDDEIAEMKSSAESAAKAEEERIRVSTEEEKKKILESAESEISAATSAARRELRQHAAQLAIALAEKKIAVSDSADKALVKEFTTSLDGGKGGRN